MCTEAGHIELVADLAGLYNNQHTADVIFIIGEEEIPFFGHKLLLWARCRSFQKYEQQFWRSRSSPGPLTFKYPQYPADIFAKVLQYIYTGKITLTETSLFEVLSLANKLEVIALSVACEDFVRQNVTSSNACHFLGQCMGNAEYRNLAAICHEFIRKHAFECVKKPTWLTLSKADIIKLISCDEFCLEEDEVWRAVIRWAKYKVNLAADKEPIHWNIEEKAAISKVLDGVIEHVKFLLIDSEVFAQEVEPTGMVPMELSLQRYRNAAVAAVQSVHTETTALRPRVPLQQFLDSILLPLEAMQYQRILNDWYGSPKQTWRLLYRASRDGYKASDFHKHCNGFAPTFTVVRGASGNLCGGFSDVAWSDGNRSVHGRFLPSHRSFLFTLHNKQDVPPTKFDVVNSKLATIHHANYGPIFGAGADLCISDQCNTNMHSYSNLAHSYDGEKASCSLLMGDYNFTVQDYEVFTVFKEV